MSVVYELSVLLLQFKADYSLEFIIDYSAKCQFKLQSLIVRVRNSGYDNSTRFNDFISFTLQSQITCHQHYRPTRNDDQCNNTKTRVAFIFSRDSKSCPVVQNKFAVLSIEQQLVAGPVASAYSVAYFLSTRRWVDTTSSAKMPPHGQRECGSTRLHEVQENVSESNSRLWFV